MTFTNELWFNHIVLGSDEPYWSLGFEVFYYVFWGAVAFSPEKLRLPLAIALICAGGPKIGMYLPLWLLGVVAYDLTVLDRMKQFPRWLGFFSIATCPLFYLLDRKFLRGGGELYAPLSFGQMIHDGTYYTLIGLGVVFLILGFEVAFRASKLRLLHFLSHSIRWAAGGSFTLYILHQPIAVLVRAFLRQTPTPLKGAILIALVYGLTQLVSYFGERQKRWFDTSLRQGVGLLTRSRAALPPPGAAPPSR